MTRLTRLCRAVGVGLAVATATLSMTQAADAAPAPPSVPSNLVPDSGQVFLVGHAKGVQIYTCDGVKWGPSTPRADLVDDAGNLIVKHSAGPTWESTVDRSAVLGARKESAPSPAPGPAIPWLLLTTTPKDGAPVGLLTDTKFIQRLETKGGTAPPDAACKAQTLNKVVEVPYKADYYFWK
jgi:Protein of unknown function (DUF3455)